MMTDREMTRTAMVAAAVAAVVMTDTEYRRTGSGRPARVKNGEEERGSRWDSDAEYFGGVKWPVDSSDKLD